MGYIVECFNSALNSNKLLTLQQNQRELAKKYNVTLQYFTHEIEGYKRITTRSDNIHIAQFDDVSVETLYKYILDVCKCKYYKIDCIYIDDLPFGMLYASPRYLKRLNKDSAKMIKQKLAGEKKQEMIAIQNIIKQNY